MAYSELNRLKWTGKLYGCIVTIIHRGAPNNELLILGRDITAVKKSYFLYINEFGEEIHIPMHRIIKIESEGRILWQKRGR